MRFVCDSCRAQYMISDDKVGAKGVKVRCKKCGYVILVRRADSTQVASMPQGGPEMAAASGSLPTEPTYDRPTRPHDALSDPSASPPPNPSLADDAVAAATGANGSAVTSFGGNGAGSGVLGGIEDDEIGAVFDQVLKSGSHKIDSAESGKPSDDEDSHDVPLGDENDELINTRVVSADTLRKMAAESAQGTGRAEALARSNDEPHGGNGAAGPEEKAPEKGNGVPDNDWFVAVDERQVGPIPLDKLKDMWERGEVGPDSLCWRAGFSDWTA